MDFRRVVELNNPRRELGGTGYLIRDNLILTARHIVDEKNGPEMLKASYEVRFIGDYIQGRKEGNLEECYLCWDDPKHDLALLKIENDKPSFLSSRETNIRFGKLGYKTAQRAEGCGFPKAQEIEDRQNPIELRGYLSWVNALKEDQLQLQIDSLIPDYHEEWQGISGAALFVDDLLVGVVVETKKSFAEKALWATPISAVADNPEFCRLVAGISNSSLPIEEVGSRDTTFPNRNEYFFINNAKNDIYIRLKRSLGDTKVIKVKKETRPELIWNPQSEKVKFGVQKSETLSNVGIIDVFNSAKGRLLILGEPGSGKTTELLLLAKDLVSFAELNPEHPIPVIFELSSWSKEKSIERWLVEQLKLMYPFLGNNASSLISNRRILPLFDGLDELKPILQQNCIQAINRFLREELCSQYVVICCRRAAYEQAVKEESGKLQKKFLLRLNEAILLKGLSSEQIKQYLTTIEKLDLWRTVRKDKALLSIARKPLFLSILRFIALHDKFSIQEWNCLESDRARQNYLFKAFWDAALGRELVSAEALDKGIKSQSYNKREPPNELQIQTWLSWLAQKLEESGSKGYFLIEQLQPLWLEQSSHRIEYFLIYSAISSIIVSFVLTVSQVLRGGLIFIITLILAMSILLKISSNWWFISIRRAPKLSFKVIISGLEEGVGYSIFAVIFFGFLFGIRRGIIVAISSGLISAMVSTVGFYVYSVLKDARSSDYTSRPNQGIKELTQNSIRWTILGALIGIIWPAILIFREWVSYKLVPGATTTGMFFAILSGFLVTVPDPITSSGLGLLIGLLLGGLDCIQHFALRLVLLRKGYTPWDYSRFLNYCTERLFMERVGGRYRFIHESFRKYISETK